MKKLPSDNVKFTEKIIDVMETYLEVKCNFSVTRDFRNNSVIFRILREIFFSMTYEKSYKIAGVQSLFKHFAVKIFFAVPEF